MLGFQETLEKLSITDNKSILEATILLDILPH